MAYADFTAHDLRAKFGIEFQAKSLFDEVKPIAPSEWLNTSLKMGRAFGRSTTKAYHERILTPILMELSHRNHHNFAIHSGARMDVDEALGLCGVCDFIFSFNKIQDFVMSPVFYVMEAKIMNVEEAAAQLIGAKMMNEKENKPINTLYGCSTTGVEWRFLKYTDNQIIIDGTRYLINELPELLGVLQYIIEESSKQIPELVLSN